jgi:hypothetical protein
MLRSIHEEGAQLSGVHVENDVLAETEDPPTMARAVVKPPVPGHLLDVNPNECKTVTRVSPKRVE